MKLPNQLHYEIAVGVSVVVGLLCSGAVMQDRPFIGALLATAYVVLTLSLPSV
jgi:hypothetical protein